MFAVAGMVVNVCCNSMCTKDSILTFISHSPFGLVLMDGEWKLGLNLFISARKSIASAVLL